MTQLILASASPRRSHLMRELGLTFSVVPSNVNEDDIHFDDPSELVEALAYAKAAQVAQGVDQGLVIGSDTIVVMDGLVLGKPVSDDDAMRMLRELSGREHHVYSGISVIDASTGRTAVDHSVTTVRFRSLTERSIRNYVRTGEPADKAGAYAIQGIGSLLVESINGDYFTVVGLPLGLLAELLAEFGVNIL